MIRIIQIVLVVLISTHVIVSTDEGRSLKCYHGARRPDDRLLQQQYSDWLLGDGNYHDSFQLIPQNVHKMEASFGGLFPRYHNRFGHMYGDRTCLATLPNNTYHLMDRTTCPYYINIWYSNSRYPRYMATARCKCPRCYDNNGTQPAINGGKRRSPSRCVEITYKFKVLKQELNDHGKPLCDNGTVYRYIEAFETIAVGCACAITNDKHISRETLKTPEHI